MAIGLSRGTSSLMITQMPCVPFRFTVTVGELHRHEVVIGLRVLAEGHIVKSTWYLGEATM